MDARQNETTVSIPQSGFWWVEVSTNPSLRSARPVSIPQSGFWWVEAAVTEDHAVVAHVSIPQSGFWWVEVPFRVLRAPLSRSFQSPSRDSGGLKPHSRTRTRRGHCKFQSPSRDSGGLKKLDTPYYIKRDLSFNPPVGILVG